VIETVDYIEGLQVNLVPQGSITDQVHVFERREVQAINAALAAGRPLLVRGEPGTGKSQLARAAAKVLGRAYVSFVVDGQTESRDLLWQLDAVQRLAEAQLVGALRVGDAETALARLAIENFLRPGPLWWAFDWDDAATQARRVKVPAPPQPDGGDPGRGCVVLVDEIDKAESEVPNGLLEALGAGQLTPLGRSEPVQAGSPPPLVMITTNEERVLPDAFLRRCLVLELSIPDEDEGTLIEFLMRRGRAHFPISGDAILRKAAELLAADRYAARDAQRRPLPGQAEYLDLLRAATTLYPRSAKRQVEALEELAEYTSRKHAGRKVP
jgi:MoxR-like ATPase